MNLSGLEVLVVPFFLILTRITGIMVALPIFGYIMMPVTFRAAFATVLAWGLMLSIPEIHAPDGMFPALIFEFLVGACIGFTTRVILAGVEAAGEITGMQMGFGFQKTVNPLSKESNGPVTSVYFAIAGVLFFVTGAHHNIIKALAVSLRTMPPGTFVYVPQWDLLVIETGTALFSTGFRLALPLIIVALLTQGSFGVLTKVAPQLNVWALGFMFLVAAGMISLNIFAPSINNEVVYLLDQASDRMLELLVI